MDALDIASGAEPFWPGGPADNFAALFAATLRIEAPGRYTFYLASDDGSALYLDGVRVIDVDGVHPAFEQRGERELSAGAHALEVRYFEQIGDQALLLEWAGPDTEGARRLIAGAALGQNGTSWNRWLRWLAPRGD